MAENKREEVSGEFYVLRTRTSAERTERSKQQSLNSSQGALSSIRAAFKRRHSQPQVDRSRQGRRSNPVTKATKTGRRPEISVLSVEPPLPAATWFAGASGGFGQQGLLGDFGSRLSSVPEWDGSIPTSDQAPPSYDQVIKEKTWEQEEAPPPTALPRWSLTNSTATQTDSVKEHSTQPAGAATHTPQLSGSEDLVWKLKKPPRPSQPKPWSTAKASGSQVDADPPPDPPTPNHGSSQINTDQSASVVSSHICETPSVQLQALEPSTTPVPVPRPRSKHKQTSTNEVKVQTLVELHDSDTVTSLEYGTGPAGLCLLELLEAFGSDPPLDPSCFKAHTEDQGNQNGEDLNENMTALHSDRNIRDRIQAFERQTGTNEASAPSPRPRNIYSKPPVVAPKPSIAPRRSISAAAEEEATAAQENVYENITVSITPFSPAQAIVPVPALRPLPPRKPSSSSLDASKPKPPVKTRPSLIRSNNVSSQEEKVDFKALFPPVKPSKELLNLNNHNSTGLVQNTVQALSTVENVYVDLPASNGPVKPTYGGLLSSTASTQPGGRRPTVIRVPSTRNQNEQKLSDFAPPLPVQGAVGGTPLPTKLSNWDPFGIAADLTLPPRPSGGKVPPPRPPPAKTGPGRPPPPRQNSAQRAPLQQGAPLSSASQTQHRQGRRPSKKGPVLPPRPNPGHRLYNNYTLEIPHGIAQFDYNGTHTGELSFQKNEVLVLLNQIDSRTFECQVGDARGVVQDTCMKIITPLSTHSNYADNPGPQESRSHQGVVSPVESGGLQVQVLYNFTPEGAGELGLRAGDIVSDVEQLDSEWYMGTCRGSRGFFPINYVKHLPGPPTTTVAPTNERRAPRSAATVSGPRCVARFDFEGEQTDELSFCEGDVIRLQEYLGEEWVLGELGGHVGIFPLNFVEVVEDLPPQGVQSSNRVPLPGMTGSHSIQAAAPSSQVDAQGVEWAVALYDFTAETEEDLPFRQGDMILVTAHIDEEWCSGRLNGREGLFPSAFIQTRSGGI